MVVEILCDARRRKRSLLCVNEHLGDRRTRAKFTRQNDLSRKIVNDEIVFVRGKGAKAEHTLRYVSISLSAGLCKKNSSEQFLHKKIVNDEIIFVRGKATKPQHSRPM